MMISRGEVWRVNLSPTKGAEMRKTRPCVVISSYDIGKLSLKIVVPVTEWKPSFEHIVWFVRLEPNSTNGLSKVSAVDAFQIRSVAVDRFLDKLGAVSAEELEDIAAAVAIVLEINL